MKQITISEALYKQIQDSASASEKTPQEWLTDAIIEQATRERAEAQNIDLDLLIRNFEKRGITLTPKELAKRAKQCERVGGIMELARELDLSPREISAIAFHTA